LQRPLEWSWPSYAPFQIDRLLNFPKAWHSCAFIVYKEEDNGVAALNQ
jgi:hypothetical protein